MAVIFIVLAGRKFNVPLDRLHKKREKCNKQAVIIALLSCHDLLASPRDCAKHNEQDGNHIDTNYRNGERPES